MFTGGESSKSLRTRIKLGPSRDRDAGGLDELRKACGESSHVAMVFFGENDWEKVPSGYVKIAIENGDV